MISSYKHFLGFAKENLSPRECEIIRTHPNEFRDITLLALHHIRNCKFFNIASFESSLDAIQPMLYYAEQLLPTDSAAFIHANAQLAAVAFVFEIEALLADETI